MGKRLKKQAWNNEPFKAILATEIALGTDPKKAKIH
jgi:hypothetical protein